MTATDCLPGLHPESTELMDAFFETVPGLCLLLDSKGCIRKANAATEQLIGCSGLDLLSVPVSALMDPDWAALVEQRLGEVVAHESADPVVTPWRTHSGDTRMVEWRCRKVPSLVSDECQILLAGTDVTDLLSGQVDARLHQHWLGTCHDLPFIGMATVSPPDGRWLHFNARFLEILGYSRDELTHLTWEDITHPEDISGEAIEFQRAVTGEIECYSLDKRFLHKSGSVIHTAVHVNAVRRAEGSLRHLIVMIHDITRLKLAEENLRLQTAALHAAAAERLAVEEKLRESEGLFRSLMDNLPHCVFRKDREGRFTFVNRPLCELLGRSADDIIGKTEADLHPEEVARKHMADDQRVLETGKPVTLHIEYDGHDGDRRTVEVIRHPIYSHDSAIAGIQGVFWDITDRLRAESERRRMEIQLRHAQKLEAIGQLAAGIAHEINTPTQYIGDNTRFVRDAFQDVRRVQSCYANLLNAARSQSVAAELIREIEDLSRDLDLDYLCEEIPRALEQSLEGVSRVANIVRAMKEFSHPGNEVKTATDLNRAIESTLTVTRNEWKYVAEMVMDLDPNLPLVPCLPGELNQVILNLVVNAAHAIADVVRDQPGTKGTITVSTRRIDDHVRISVSDTGTGIPPSASSRIFDPFFTTKPVGKGTGQGLAIAHSVVVDKHGGTIRFETAMGQGTTFIVDLPLEPSTRNAPNAARS